MVLLVEPERGGVQANTAALLLRRGRRGRNGGRFVAKVLATAGAALRLQQRPRGSDAPHANSAPLPALLRADGGLTGHLPSGWRRSRAKNLCAAAQVAEKRLLARVHYR
jgi:hypothetical protein